MPWGGTRRFIAAATPALLAVVICGGLSVAADGTPPDLRGVLAPPPAADYIEATPRDDTLDGAFDAKRYADFVSAVNEDDDSGLATDLVAYGFSRGYGLTWIQRGTRYYLEEFVFEFRFATYARVPSADIPTAIGLDPTAIVATTAKFGLATRAFYAPGVEPA